MLSLEGALLVGAVPCVVFLIMGVAGEELLCCLGCAM